MSSTVEQETQTVNIPYGIAPCYWKGQSRWCVVVKGWKHVALNYAKPEFAMQKAASFARSCHKDFVNFQGVPIHFTFQEVAA